MNEEWGFNTLDPDFTRIDELSEEDIWREIDYIESILTVARFNKKEYDLQNGKFKQLSIVLQKLIYYTKRFGVEFDNEDYQDTIQKNDSYCAWFTFWLNHFMGMGYERYKRFQCAKIDGKNVDEFLPSTSWKEEYCKVKRKEKK